jgi:4a-hydroxytetrahydrobiopterin dehydratase
MPDEVSATQFDTTAGVEEWRVVGDGACAYYRTGSFAVGAELVRGISELADLDQRHPDIDVRHEGVLVRLITFAPGFFGLSERDLELAQQISAVAREQGLSADPSLIQAFNVTIDALVLDDVLPFWRAVLGYSDRGDGPEDIIDPRWRGPTVWFQQMAEPRTERNRIHLDVWVPKELAQARVDAAIAAGGHLVSDAGAPAWWVLSDAEGNEACVSSIAGRG